MKLLEKLRKEEEVLNVDISSINYARNQFEIMKEENWKVIKGVDMKCVYDILDIPDPRENIPAESKEYNFLGKIDKGYVNYKKLNADEALKALNSRFPFWPGGCSGKHRILMKEDMYEKHSLKLAYYCKVRITDEKFWTRETNLLDINFTIALDKHPAYFKKS